MDCPFCQNYRLSKASADDVHTEYASPSALADLAAELRPRGNIGVAFTYNEPIVGWEYVRDVAAEVRARSMKNVAVTNGSAEKPVLSALLPYIDAYNIDLKCFTESGYRKLGGDLSAVKAFIETAAAAAHVELTTLVVPGLNDGCGEMRELASWVASVDRKIPLHITRFFPRRLMSSAEPTPLDTLYRLAETAREKLETVIVGNV